MTMVLTVQFPCMVTEIYGRYRNRIASMPGHEPYNARVRIVRRIRKRDGTLDGDRVEVEVFVRDDLRGLVALHGKARWITAEYLLCDALVFENRKTLRQFIDSGELELAL